MSSSAVIPSETTTLQNLQTAFTGESNAHVRYMAFAKKADEEGYCQIASLLRAAARAEQIHAASHANVITKMGGKAQAEIQPPVVNSTRENLAVAISGEEYERDVTYPGFIKQADAQKNSLAVRTFNRALKAEAEHARLYKEGLAHLEQMKTKTAYYVCAICGYTVEKLTFDRCPVCKNPKEKFERID
jgi:rubrerythrin